MKIFNDRRGDTMVEVLLGITFFSIVCLGAYSLTNISLVSTRSSLDYNLVRNYMDAQATGLRFLQNAYLSSKNTGTTLVPALQWIGLRNDIISNASTNPIDFGVNTNTCPEIPTTSFIINPKDSTVTYADDGTGRIVKSSSGLSRLDFNSDTNNITRANGLWIEAKRTTSDSSSYIDFYIRACWYEFGNSNASTLATIVRLYDI